MNKIKHNETPLVNVERNPLVIIISLLLSLGCVYLTFITLFKKEAFEIQPLVFFLFVPTLFICFQTLWFILHPFGVVYENRVEIRKTFFNFKQWFFIDIKKVGDLKAKGFVITYNDDEMELIKFIGINPTHKKLMQEAFVKYVALSLEKRITTT